METTIVSRDYIGGNQELYKDNGKETGKIYEGRSAHVSLPWTIPLRVQGPK